MSPRAITSSAASSLTVWRGHSCPRNAYSKSAFAGNLFKSLLISAALAITPYAAAQHASAPAHSAARHSHSPGINSSGARNAHSAFRRSSPLLSPFGSLPFPFFGDSFNPDDIYSTGYPVASQPPPSLMEAVRQLGGSATASSAQAMSPPTTHQPSSTDPLMIELQNGRYVRVNSAAINGDAEPLNLTPNHQPNSTHTPPLATASQALPSAVLIFRDGHSEEVRDYTIADGILYARGDYYTDGYWSKKIDLASLNVPQTLQANNDRNVKFILPSSSNEVVTRF
jgi:hypothetical protein